MILEKKLKCSGIEQLLTDCKEAYDTPGRKFCITFSLSLEVGQVNICKLVAQFNILPIRLHETVHESLSYTKVSAHKSQTN
jgi:hypothetical protein